MFKNACRERGANLQESVKVSGFENYASFVCTEATRLPWPTDEICNNALQGIASGCNKAGHQNCIVHLPGLLPRT